MLLAFWTLPLEWTQMQLRVVGIPWYHREDSEELRSVLSDARALPCNYNVWLRAAENVVDQTEKKGYRTIKVHIDPKVFPKWCRSRGLTADAKARRQYANTLAKLGTQLAPRQPASGPSELRLANASTPSARSLARFRCDRPRDQPSGQLV